MRHPKLQVLLRHREAIFVSLALWGVACEAKTEAEMCIPAAAPDRDACMAEGCVDPDSEDAVWNPEFHFCMEVADPGACGACEDESECINKAREMYNDVEGVAGSDVWVSDTLCGPVSDDDRCCYLVRFETSVAGRAFATAQERVRVAPTVFEDSTSGNALSEYWRRVAEIEHASVASFARFTLQLMALGAPPKLLEQAHAAGLDEIKHARFAYELAERFGGSSMRAGALDVSGALEPGLMGDPEAILRATLHEGCIGETLAAAWAAVAAARCEDPWTKRVLEEIAEDELRHAALAWETLAWARNAFPDALAKALEDWRRDLQPFADDPKGMPEWGVLGIEEETAISDRVMASTIAPAIEALLA